MRDMGGIPDVYQPVSGLLTIESYLFGADPTMDVNASHFRLTITVGPNLS